MSNEIYTTNCKIYNNYNDALRVLENRKRETYELCGIESVKFNDKGDLNIGYIVKETDDLTYGVYSNEKVKEFYTPKYVFNHLASYLDLPTRLYDYIDAFRRLGSGEIEICLANFSDNIKMLMNHRIEQQEKSNRMRTHFITIFDDIFGKFPRIIRSEIYRPYEDHNALLDFNNNLDKVNNNSDASFYFKRARLSPYRSTFEYLNDSSKAKLTKVGEEVSHGISNFNSETKDSSNGFQYLIMRLVCTNGLTSTFTDSEIRVRHMGDDFSLRSQKGFIKILKLGQNFAKMFSELDQKSKKISNDWNDLIDIPNELLAMRTNEKRELIEVAQKENYAFSPYGLVQALTYKSNHGVNKDKSYDLLNEKAIKIMQNVEKVNQWTPPRLKGKQPKDNTTEIDVSDIEFL